MRTAEFITPNHPDKMCDIISDTILDELIKKDPFAKCRIETMGGHEKVSITGEINSNQTLSDSEIKSIVKNISGVSDTTINIKTQNENFLKCSNEGLSDDCGTAIGYASTECESLVPFEYELARSLTKYLYDYYPYDGKVQITVNGDDAVIYSAFQNSKSSHLEELIKDFFKNYSYDLAKRKVFPAKIICNPLGEWNIGGFDTNSGSSGKKGILDTYGPRMPHGGGVMSGKDCTKLDRTLTLMARKVAVDCIKKYQLSYAIVELSYMLGDEFPIQAKIKGNDQGINFETGVKIYDVSGYDLSIPSIIEFLDLRNVKYSEISKWGYFGLQNSWDKIF